MVTGIYPTAARPHSGTFVKSQVESLEAAGVEVEVVHPGPRTMPLRYLSATGRVFLKSLRGHFDIIHGHYGLWCLAARVQWTTPVVAAYLGDDVLGTHSGKGYYTRKSLMTRRVSRWLARHVDAVTVKTEEMRRALSTNGAHVIPDGIDFELFRPIARDEARTRLGWDADCYYIVFGNNPQIPVKDFPLAQAAVASLARRGIQSELIVAHGLAQPTFVQYINASNALLLTSIAEGSPNVVKEAMACNVPVVATDVGDVAEVVGHTAGCAVCPRDPEILAEGLERALRHTGPTTGREDIRHLDRRVIAQQIIDVYEHVMNRGPASLDGAYAPIRALFVTGAYPTEQRPHWGTFIKSQVESLRAAGIDVEVVHPRSGPMPLRYATATARTFFRAVSRRVDVVHGHYGLWCLVARLQRTTPVIASFMGDDVMGTPTSHGGFTRKSLLVGRVSRWLSRHVDAVIVKSEGMKRAIPAPGAYVIPNGVDFDLFRPIPRDKARAALGWNPMGYYVLFANNPRIPRKDFPLAQASIDRLKDRGITAELVIANALSQEALVWYLNASNALLLSSMAEGSPNGVKEAMACNVPVVATDVGDVAQVIGRTPGCAVCPRDPEVLAEGLERALLHTGPTTGRGDIRYLDRKVIAPQIIAVYEHVMNRRPVSLDGA
jgi:glycosyltransferase involved in cell wall biosynthesis